MLNLEDRRAEGGCQVLLHMGGERSAPAHNEADAAAKGGLEGAEDVLVQERRCLHTQQHAQSLLLSLTTLHVQVRQVGTIRHC